MLAHTAYYKEESDVDTLLQKAVDFVWPVPYFGKIYCACRALSKVKLYLNLDVSCLSSLLGTFPHATKRKQAYQWLILRMSRRDS